MDSLIAPDTRPYLGFTQPSIGSSSSLIFLAVTRRSKKEKKMPLSVGILAWNVKNLRDRAYAGLPHETARNKALAKDADTTLSQIQRILACELAAGIDMIEALATALHVQPKELLTPYFDLGTDKAKPALPALESDSALLQRR